MIKVLKRIFTKFCGHWRLALVILVGVILQQLIIVQFIYPANRLLPLTRIDGVNFGGWKKTDASTRLDDLYSNSTIGLYFRNAKKPYVSPKIDEIGMAVINQDRFNSFDYPWYFRIIPTSILWAQYFIYQQPGPEYARDLSKLESYLDDLFSEPCTAAAKNAGLKFVGKKYQIIPSQSGGKCDNIDAVTKTLSVIEPRLDNIRAEIGSTLVNPTVDDDDARALGEQLIKQVGSGVTIVVNDAKQQIPASEIFSWMDFVIDDGKLIYVLSSIKAASYLENQIASKVVVNPGVTTVSTYDFSEVSRQVGNNGVGLNYPKTLDSIKSSIDSGDTARAVTIIIAPKVEYTRSYSRDDASISAMVQQYAEDHSGIKSISLIELAGKRRRASYNADTQLTAASTYKLFVAFSTLKRVESGAWNWNDQILENQDLTACFDNMIVYSDNACAEALLEKIGNNVATNEAHDIGCSNTSFITGTGYAKTSAADLALFLAQLQSGLILNNQVNRDILIDAMKRNTYRSGIPAGVSGQVADKVGFGEGIINDAGIIYSPNGTFVLAIMTEESSWGTIADFAGSVESFLY